MVQVRQKDSWEEGQVSDKRSHWTGYEGLAPETSDEPEGEM
jgi:hypothetical protein